MVIPGYTDFGTRVKYLYNPKSGEATVPKKTTEDGRPAHWMRTRSPRMASSLLILVLQESNESDSELSTPSRSTPSRKGGWFSY